MKVKIWDDKDSEDGGNSKAEFTTEDARSCYGIPVMKITGGNLEGVYGSGDYLPNGIPASMNANEIINGSGSHSLKLIEAARRFLGK